MHSASKARAAEEQNIISLADLTVQQLSSLREQCSEDLSMLQASRSKLKLAETKFAQSASFLGTISAAPDSCEMIVPLTSTVSVPAKVGDKENVLVDIGTGYFLKKTLSEAQDFYNRRRTFVLARIENVDEIVRTKTLQLRAISDMAQLKMAFADQRPKP